MRLTLAAFRGDWIMEREIEDRLAGRAGRLTGQATFTPDGQGLRYHEAGTLRFPGQPALSASQGYLWRPAAAGIAVLFGDGRPFHQIALHGDAPEARHDCAPDIYHVRYDFSGWPVWSALWRVSGPRKDYEMHTVYRRGDRQS